MTAKRTYGSEVIAKLIGKTSRRVNQMAAEGILTRDADGQFDLWTAIPENCQYLESRAAAPSLSDGKVRVTELQAQLLEIDLKERNGELVDLDQAVILFESALARCRVRLLAIPKRVAPELVGIKSAETSAAIIETAVHEALAEISEIRVDSEADKPGAKNHNGAAAKADRKPVGRRKPKTKPRGKRRARKVADK